MTIQGYGHVFSRNPLDRGETERREDSEIKVRSQIASKTTTCVERRWCGCQRYLEKNKTKNDRKLYKL